MSVPSGLKTTPLIGAWCLSRRKISLEFCTSHIVALLSLSSVFASTIRSLPGLKAILAWAAPRLPSQHFGAYVVSGPLQRIDFFAPGDVPYLNMIIQVGRSYPAVVRAEGYARYPSGRVQRTMLVSCEQHLPQRLLGLFSVPHPGCLNGKQEPQPGVGRDQRSGVCRKLPREGDLLLLLRRSGADRSPV